MKLKLVLLILGFLIVNISFGQDREKYMEIKNDAMKLYDSKEFKKSADRFKEAFDVLNGKAYPNDRYNAACSYALSGDKERSFYHLLRLANSKSKYKNYRHLIKDTDLTLLHEDNRWSELLSIVKGNKDEFEKDFDKPLVATLDVIHEEDQKYRGQIREIEEKHGRESKEMKSLWKTINTKDSINLIKIEKILDERGWLGRKVIGRRGNSTLFLVIQHSGIETQLKYLPMMREAVTKGNAQGSSLALLEDRVALRQGERQIYGSQIGRDSETGEFFVSPLIDPDNVDVRRAKVGLGPISNYISHWDMTWDVEKHKARTVKTELNKDK